METTTDQRGWVLLTDGEEVGPVRMGVTSTPDSGLLVLRQDEDEIHLTPAMVRRMLQLVDRAWNRRSLRPRRGSAPTTGSIHWPGRGASRNGGRRPGGLGAPPPPSRLPSTSPSSSSGAAAVVGTSRTSRRRRRPSWTGSAMPWVLPEDDTTHIPVVTFRSAVGPPSVDVIMERC